MEEVEELKEIMNTLLTLAKELPRIIRDILEVLYDKELARKAAESFATFYKTLREQGFSEEEAMKMAKKFYEDSLSIKSILKGLKEIKVERIVREEKKE